MKGRFEQPRNGHRPDPAPQAPRRPAARSGDPYSQDGYRQDPYGQNGYQQDPYNQNGYQQDPYGPSGYQQDPYGQNGYQQDPYGQNGYQQDPYDQNGYQQDPYDQNSYQQAPRSNSGRNGGGNRRQPPQGGRNEKGGFGWAVLSFFIPLVGLILWLVWKKNKPRAAKSSIIGALIGFITQLVLILALVIGGSLYYNHMLDKMNIVEMTKPVYTQAPTEAPLITEATEAETTEATEAPTTEPPVAQRDDFINFLVVGQAARANESERFADTMLVCTLNKFDNSITVTSLLRDSFVQPPPFRNKYFGQIKLTTVYHMGSYYDNGNVAGSMELMNNTLYDNFGLEIDYNFEISFDVFTAILDELGGVEIEIDEAECNYLNEHLETADWKDYWYEPGWVELDGWSGLVYARMRKAEGDADSDIKRTARQRKLMEAVMDKVKGMSIADVQRIANEVLPMITTNMSKDEITSMLKTVLPMLPNMEFKSGGTCPEKYSGVMVDIYHDGMYHSVLKFVPQETKKHMRELTLGEVSE